MQIEPLQTTTVWSFPKRGSWATHSGSYRGNWAPQVPQNLIQRYTVAGDLVLDPMVGSGTSLIECRILNRRGIGLDINPDAVNLAMQRLAFKCEHSPEISLYGGDARNLPQVASGQVALALLHPPYLNIVRYSAGRIAGDLSNCADVDGFLSELRLVAREMFRVLRPGGYCALLIGDVRRRGEYIPLGFKTLGVFSESGFTLKESVIKLQFNCRSTSFWEERVPDFLLIMHENLLIFRKPDQCLELSQ